MASPDRISLEALRKTINGVFDFVEKEGVTEVELKQNFYWSVPAEALYAMESQPQQLDVGSLKDDWDFVLSSYKNADEQLPIMFIHIAPLLQALSEVLPNYPAPRERTKEG